LHAFCHGGIDAVEPRFQKLEDKLNSIKRLNDSFGGKQLLFFTLEGCEGSDSSGGALDMSSSLLEAIVQMLNAPSAYERLSVGTAVNHPKRGRGVIEEIMPDLRRAVRFHDGDVHRYKPESLYKLLDTLSTDTSLMNEAEKEAERQALSKTLGLTVVWDRPELTRKILASIQEEEPGAMREVCNALQRAIGLHRHDVVKLFLGVAGMTIENMNMGKLCAIPDETKFLSSNERLQTRLRLLVFETSSKDRPHALYQKALNRLFMSISPILRQELHAEDVTRPNDVFYWLILQGNEGMARDVWPFCDNPVHVALLGAAICMKMSQTITQGQQAMRERSARLQEWALGAIEEAPDEKHAHSVLERSIREDRLYTVLDIALSTGAKKLLFQRHSISLIERWWRGEFTGAEVSLPQGINYLSIALECVFPFANTLLWPKEEAVEAPKNAYGSTVFYDALGMAFSISSKEKELNTAAMLDAAMLDAAKLDAAAAGQPSTATKLTSAASTESIDVEVRKRRGSKLARFSEMMQNDLQAEASAEVVRTSSYGLGSWFSRLRTFYTIPAVKFVWRVLFQLLLTVLYVMLIMNFKSPAELDPRFTDNPIELIPFTKNLNSVEIAWLLCELGLWLDKRHQQVLRSRSTGAAAGGKGVAYLSDALFVVAVGVRIAMERPYAANDFDEAKYLYDIYQVLVSLKAMLVISLDCMPYLSEYQPLGVLYIIVCAMVQDFITWMLLFAVMTSAFMVMLMGLQNAGKYTNYVDDGQLQMNQINMSALTKDEIELHFDYNVAQGGSWAPLWALFGSFQPERYDSLVSALMWSYMLLSSVGLVNLLVAMFADTYNKISEEAENEYVFLRCTRLFEFKDSVLPLPPVLNLPIIFRDIAIGICNARQTVCFNQIKAFIALRKTATAAPSAAATSTARSFHSARASILATIGRSSSDVRGRSATPPPNDGLPGRPSPLSAASSTPSPNPRSPRVSKEVVAPHNHSLQKAKRRSLTARMPTSMNLLGAHEPKKRRAATIFDGKLLAQEYLKRVEAEEKDTVYAHARNLRTELGTLSAASELAAKQREDEFVTMSTRVGGVEKQFGDIRDSLRAIQAQLSELAQPAATVEAVANAPSAEGGGD